MTTKLGEDADHQDMVFANINKLLYLYFKINHIINLDKKKEITWLKFHILKLTKFTKNIFQNLEYMMFLQNVRIYLDE